MKEINNYIQNRVMPILAPLQMELLIKQPASIKEYCIEWLKRYSICCVIQTTLSMMIPRNYLVMSNRKKSSKNVAEKD